MWWSDLGRVPYRATVFRLHRGVVEGLRLGAWSRGLLLFQEFEPVITFGSRGGRENLLLEPEELERRGFELVEIDRGGNATYHGPGQLVATPFLRLDQWNLGLHAYINRLEEVTIKTVQAFGPGAYRHGEHTGVWVREGKIAAIGIGVRRRVVFHGVSINVDPAQEHFSYLVPCGLQEEKNAFMANYSDHVPDLAGVRDEFRYWFSRVFEVELEYVSPARLVEWIGGAD